MTRIQVCVCMSACVSKTVSCYHVWLTSSTILFRVTKLVGQENEAGHRCRAAFLTLSSLSAPRSIPLPTLRHDTQQPPCPKQMIPWLLLTSHPGRPFQSRLIFSSPLVKALLNYHVFKWNYALFSHSMFSQSTVLSLIQFFVWSPLHFKQGSLTLYCGVLPFFYLFVVPQSDTHWTQTNAGYLLGGKSHRMTDYWWHAHTETKQRFTNYIESEKRGKVL